MNINSKMLMTVLAVTAIVCSLSVVITPSEVDSDTITQNPAANADLGELIIQYNDDALTIELQQGAEYTLTSPGGFYGDSLTIIGNGANVTVTDQVQINTNTNTERSLSITNVNFKGSMTGSTNPELSFAHFQDASISGCSSSGMMLTISSHDALDTTINVSKCRFEPAGNNTMTANYPLTVKGYHIHITDCEVNGFARGINVWLGEEAPSTAFVDTCKVTGATSKCGVQISYGSSDMHVLVTGCIFTNCSSGISLHETSDEDATVVSMENTFSGCTSDILYAGGSALSMLSVGDTFQASDGTKRTPVIAGDDGTAAPSDTLMVSDWYETGIIQNETDLREFATMVNSGIDFGGKTVQLGDDITLTDDWTPIGITVGDADFPFRGTFDGKEHTISGLKISGADTPGYSGFDTNYAAYGFFGGVVGGTVKDVTFEDFTITTPGSNTQNNNTVAVAVGALVNSGEISGITIGEGAITGHSRVAGVVGFIGGANTGTPAHEATGGTITVSNNTNNADVTSNIISLNGTPSYGTAAGIISTSNEKNTDIVKIVISGNINNGTVKGFNAAGIIATDFSNTTPTELKDNQNHGDITASYTDHYNAVALGIGALKNSGTTETVTVVSGNLNTGIINSSGTASGIVGTIYKGADISGNTNEGSVTGYVYASGIVTNAFGGEIGANTNTGTIEITCAEATVTLGDNDYETSVGQIVANLNGGTLDASECITGGTVKAPSGITYSGNVVGRIAYGDAIGMDDSGDIGAVRMVGNGNFDVTLTDVNVTDLTLVAGHNDQGSEGTPYHFVYTLALEDSSIGTMSVVGECHTGINLTISGGSIDTITSDIMNNSGGETSFKLLLSGAEVGTVDVTEGESPLKIATNKGGSVDEVRNDLRVTIGIDGYNTTGNNPDENIANSGTIGYVVSETDIVENSQVSEDQVLPKYRVYAGTDLDDFNSGTGNLGIMNAISVECYENAQLPENLREDVSLFIPKNTTFTLDSEFNGEIVGYDETSRLSIAEGGSYEGLTSGEYAFTDNTDNPWGAPEVFTVNDIGYVTLQAAVDAASDGDTIYLNKDTETDPITIDKSVALDLGKHTLKIVEPTSGSSDRWGITFTSDNCSITNGTILDERSKTSATKIAVYVLGSGSHASLLTSNVTMSTYPCKEDNYSYVLRVEGDASATLNSGTIINESQNESGVGKVVGATVFGNNVKADTYNTTADLIVNTGVTIETSGYAVSGNGSNQNGTNITINGGTLKSTKSLGIYHPQDGVLTINDGSISGITGVEIRSGTLIMNGGSVEGTASSFVAVENGNGPTSEGAGIAVVQHTTVMSIDVSVKNGDVSGIKALYEANVQKNEEPVDIELFLTGGNFIAKPGEGSTAVDVADVEEFISGGTFNTDVSDYCVPGLKTTQNVDGDFIIETDETVVNIPIINVIGFIVDGEQQTYTIGFTSTVGIEWSSSNPEFATVSQDGVITFVSEGKATITAKLADADAVVGEVFVIVCAVPETNGVTFEPFTNLDLVEMFEIMEAYPDMIPEDWADASLGVLSLESESDTFTVPYSAFSTFDWMVTSENYSDYEFMVIHFPDEGGYDLPKVTASSEGLTVTTSGYSMFLFMYRTAEGGGAGTDVPTYPWWDDDDEYVPPIVPSQPENSSGDDTTTIVACAAAAVVAALMAAFLIIERRRN